MTYACKHVALTMSKNKKRVRESLKENNLLKMKLTCSPNNEQEQKKCKGIAKEKTIFKKETLMKETCLANRFWNDLRVVKISCSFILL